MYSHRLIFLFAMLLFTVVAYSPAKASIRSLQKEVVLDAGVSENNIDGSSATRIIIDTMTIKSKDQNLVNIVPPHTDCQICVPDTDQCSPCAA